MISFIKCSKTKFLGINLTKRWNFYAENQRILKGIEDINKWKGIHVHRRRQWHPTPVLLPGNSHGWRGLVGCSPWGHWGSDTTERLHFHFSLSCIGEGNGNPLQCSCLENPRDRGAWWAVCGSHRVGHDWSDLAAAADMFMDWNY